MAKKYFISYLILLISISFFVLPTISHASVLSKAPNNLGLVGYWKFDEGVGTQAEDLKNMVK